MNIDFIRALVRPVVTFVVILALVVVMIILVLKFADLDMARQVITGFMTLVATLTAFWFGSRKQNPGS